MATFADLQRDLSDPATIRRRGFRLVRELCQFVSTEDSETEVQELVLRALDHRAAFGASEVVVDGLAREVGLFPYLDPDKLSLPDLLAYECHRPTGLDDEIVLHHPQAVVYRKLLDGESV
ncbi:MAG: helicase, partial [Gemmataceae bacterium]